LLASRPQTFERLLAFHLAHEAGSELPYGLASEACDTPPAL
jgi:hypothetical protein